MRRWLAIGVTLIGLVLAGDRPAAAAGFGGVWKLTPNTPPAADTPNPREAILTLKQDGEKMTGTLVAQGKERPIYDAVVKGNELQLKVNVEEAGETKTVTLRATLEGDSLKGTVEGARPASIAFTGARQPERGLAGTWTLTITTPEKAHKPTLTIALEGEKLTGTLRPEDGAEIPLLAGSVQGETIRFEIEITANGEQLHPRFTGQRTEKGLEGTVTVGDQSFPWTGERAAAPPAK